MTNTEDELRETARQVWARARRSDPAPTVHRFEALLAAHPGHALALYHCGRAHDYAGEPGLAVALYERAFAAGLSGVELRRAVVSYGSTLRNLGRVDEAVEALRRAHERYPDDVLPVCYLALALHDAGGHGEALARVLDVVLARVDDPELVAGRWALANYAAVLLEGSAAPPGLAGLPLTGPLLDASSADRVASGR